MTNLEPAFDWIDDNEENMLEFLDDYIQYRSTPEEEAPVQRELIKPSFDDMEWDDVSIVDVSEEGNRPNVNAHLQGSGSGRNLLFNGHSDIVDVSEQDRETLWEHDPWQLTREEDRLYGRGTTDMKGPNTAMIWAVKAIMNTDIDLRGDILMSIVVGEEAVQQDVGTLPATNAILSKDIEPPFCINTEPTNNQIHTKSASLLHFDITIPGKAVHASQHNLVQYPQRTGIPNGTDVGVDAIPILREMLDKLERLEHEWNMRYSDQIWGSGGHPIAEDMQGVGAVTIVPTLVDAGDFIASVANSARIQGQLYIPPSVSRTELWGELESAVMSLQSDYDWLNDHPPVLEEGELIDEYRQHSYWPGFETPVENPGCQVMGNAVAAATGEEPVYSGFKAVNDGGFIQSTFGLDTISFGPGDTYMGAHGADEYIPRTQLIEAAKVYASMIVKWCS